MTEARKHLINGAIILVGQGLSRGLGVLLLPILTMVFLPAQFGMSALATTYISFVSVIALLGLDLTYLQSIPGVSKAEAGHNARIIWALALTSAFTAAIFGGSAWWLWGKQTPESAPWLGLGILSTVIFSVCQSQMKAERQYMRLAVALSVGGIVMYVWALLLGFSGHDDAVTLVSGYALGSSAAVLVSWPRVVLPSISELLASSRVFNLIRVGLPATIIAPMFWVISSMDRWLVAQFWGVYEAGIYSVASSISAMALLLGSVVQTLWMTEASRLNNQNEGSCSGQLAERVKEITFIFALAWLGLTSISGEIIQVFAKSPYDKAVVYLPWILTSVMLYNLYHMLSVFLILNKVLARAVIIWLVSAALFVSLSCLAPRFFGPEGVVYSQILAYSLMLVWVYGLVRKRAGLKIRLNSASLLMSGILTAGMLMCFIQEARFIASFFMLKAFVVLAFVAITAWHFRRQLFVIVSGAGNQSSDREAGMDSGR